MKTLFIPLILSLSLFANELQWVDKQIQAIKPPREGISKTKINATKSPFIVLKKIPKEKLSSTQNSSKTSKLTKNIKASKTRKKSKILLLDTIINKSARINGKWYKSNEKIGKYTITNIESRTVTLSYKKKILILSTMSKNKNLNFKSN